MKDFNLIFKLILLPFILLILISSSSIQAAEYTCDGEDVVNIHDATSDGYQSYSTGVDVAEQSRYFKFRTQINGEITIHQTNNKPVSGYWNHELTVGTNCGGKQVYDGPNTSDDSTTFNVTANTWYYVRVRERNNQNVLNFDITFDFTAAPPSIDTCPGIVMPTLNHTSITATDTFNSQSFTGLQSHFYHFIPDEDGQFEIDFNADNNNRSTTIRIYDTCGNVIASNNSSGDKTLTHDVTAGHMIIAEIERTYNGSMTYDVDFNFVVSPPSSTVWVPNGTLTSATLVPSPYTNDADDTQVLTIPGETALDVTITGQLEYHSTCQYDYVTITDSAGTTSNRYCGSINDTYTAVGPTVTLTFHSDYSVVNTGATVTIRIANQPPTFTSSPSTSVNDNTNYTYTPTTNDPDGDTVTVTATTLPGWLTFDGTTLSGVPGVVNAGNHNVTLQADDGHGGIATQSFVITVDLVTNVPPTFTSTPTTTINRNHAYTYTVTTDDANGDTVTVTATTLPAWATFDGTTLSGTPTNAGTYNVTLLADDGHGGTATQTFIITVTDNTDYQEGIQNFILINPASTRNILGSFATLGNTVECITNKRGTSNESNSYDGTCQNSTAYNDNNYMAKYIDIDNDSRTWNSSSSNFTLPVSYDQDGGNGILWAGLFWQGGINNDESYKQRRAYVDGNSYDYKYINSDESINLETTDGNKVLLKINNGSYQDIKAYNFYYDKAFGNRGGYYAAFADVTAYLQNANLAGDTTHTITIANITANEGRQQGTGDYAGWSMIVIYKESPLPGVKARNISIYNGYTTIQSGAGIRSVDISGFKLPSTGNVNAQFSAFAGEGEWIYGSTSTSYDRMIISPNSDLSGSSGMPGAADQNNIFDAILANIDRDSGNNNNMTGNNNGIDIENYDVSSIMTGYRNIDKNINTVYIGLSSNNDYITPSMMAFSAELYKPEICYDYTVQRNNFDITQDNRTIETRTGGELSINLALESLEGDFDLKNAQIGVNLTPAHNSHFTEAFYAPNNVNTFIPAIYVDDNTSKPLIALGEDISNQGGTIKKGQRYFSKFLYDLSTAYNGKFEVSLISTIDYGSGAVPSVQSTIYNEIPRCPQSDVYNPVYGTFNVERADSGNYNPVTEANQRFPLYTQVVGKDFDVSVVAYDANASPAFSSELQLSGYTVDLELINAKPFNDDKAKFICNNPDPNIIKDIMPGVNHYFVTFPSGLTTPQSRVDLSALDIQTDTALRNAAFRLWYLVDANNTIIPHECAQGAAGEACFEQLYADHIQATDNTMQADGTIGFCQTSCTNGGSDCYQCLRNYHAKVVCSRDNFSIRPASYRIKISDNDESTDPLSTKIELGQNDTTNSVANLAAGYDYKLDGQATSYLSDTTLALGYNRVFTTPSTADMISTLTFDTSTGTSCVDQNNTDWEVYFENGIIDGTAKLNNLIRHSNVGNYNYHIEDANWTLVDQNRYAFKTYPGVDDCIPNTNSISANSVTLSGCITDSVLTVNGATYTDLALTYRPYRFKLSEVNYVKHPADSRTFVYLNDFDNSYYSDLTTNPVDMAISFEGNVSALDKNNTLLTNFTNGCAADDVVLSLSRTTNPDESLLLDSNGIAIQLQQYLQHTSRYNPFTDTQTGADKNITLEKAAFQDTVNPGKALMFLHTTFKKPLNALINPFEVKYEDLNATGGLPLRSSAHMTTHIPEGNNTYDQNVTYVFAKVTPKKDLYEDVTKHYQETPIFVDIYCTLGNDCNTSFNLSIGTKGEDQIGQENWYYATIFDNTSDGTTDLVAMTDTGVNASPAVTPNDDVTFTSDTASRDDINVTVTGSTRPTTVGIDIRPVPWLLYDPIDPNGYPHFQVEFVDNSGWSGVGNTGNVIDTPSSTETADRMTW